MDDTDHVQNAHDLIKCRWFGGTANPGRNADCPRPARIREYGLVLCDPHYDAAHMDPEDCKSLVLQPEGGTR